MLFYMNNNQKQRNSKKNISVESSVSYGLTTGSLATATSLAAIKKIINPKENFDYVKIKAPFEDLDVYIENCELLTKDTAKAIAIKYPYNDPDVTVNLKIVSSVELINFNEISEDKLTIEDKVLIIGGNGVGTITKPGLQISEDEAAINPIPLNMIRKNLKKYVPNDKIAKVTISVPNGEIIAKKTMNLKLGIVGGISILGTTGIARAMSSKAYKDSLLCQLDIAIAIADEGKFNKDDIVFVPGNIGEKLSIKNLNVKKDQIVQMGNYIGFMLKEAKNRGINKIILFGHIGKLVKVAGGIFNTKHSIADGRKEIIAAHAALCEANVGVIQKIFKSQTTEDMIDILKYNNIDLDVFNSISSAIKKNCLENFDLDIDVILVDMKGKQLNSV